MSNRADRAQLESCGATRQAGGAEPFAAESKAYALN